MPHDITKQCADSLRAFAKDKYEIKLKAAHAHELVAAYLGYRSKNALLADQQFPIDNLAKAEIVVMVQDDFVEQRRKELDGLSTELPDSYTLGEAVYGPLFSDDWWASPFPPFRSFDKLARYLISNSHQYKAAFPSHREVPLAHFVAIENGADAVLLTVIHAYDPHSEETLASGMTTIRLPRVAGRVGYGAPELMPQVWTGGARRTLKSLGIQL